MIGLANSIRFIDLSRSSESDTVTKRRPVRAYMRIIYMRIYVIHVYMHSKILFWKLFCVNKRIYYIHLFHNVPIWLFCNVYVVTGNDITIDGRASAATRRIHWLQGKTICIKSNSTWSAARVLQDLYNSFILFFCRCADACNKTVLFYFYFSFIAVVQSA